MPPKKKKDKTISQILSNRPSYSGIYSPDQAIKPKFSPKKDNGIWFPPKMSPKMSVLSEELAPLEESDNDSFLKNLSSSNKSATYEEWEANEIAASILEEDDEKSAEEAALEDDVKNGEEAVSRKSGSSYDVESFANEEVVEEDVEEELLEEVMEEVEEVEEEEEEVSVEEMEEEVEYEEEVLVSEQSGDGDEPVSSASGSDSDSGSGSASVSISVSRSTTSDNMDAPKSKPKSEKPANSPKSRPKSEKSENSSNASAASGSSSSTPHSSGTGGSSGSSNSSGSSSSSGSSGSSSSLFEGTKKTLKRKSVVASQEEDDASFETDSFETDESDEFETDSEGAGSPNSNLKGQARNSSQRRKEKTDQSSDSISDQKRVSYNYGHDANDHRNQKRPSPPSRSSPRHQTSDDVPSSVSGKFKKIRAISEYSGEDDSAVVERDVEFPDDAIVPERKKKSLFGRIFGFLSSDQKDSSPKKRKDSLPKRRRQPPPADEDHGPQYMPKLYDDGVSQVTDIHSGKKKRERNRLSFSELNRLETTDSIPRRRRSQEPSYLPSIASSHMSVRNTKAALSDMDPLSVRRARDIPSEPKVGRRNTKAALSSLRPLSIRNYHPERDSKKVALCELEPLSVGISLTPSLADNESDDLRPFRYDIESGWRQAKDDSPSPNAPSEKPPQVDIEYMLRMNREKNTAAEKARAQREAENRGRIVAEKKAQRMREEEDRRRAERERARQEVESIDDSDDTSEDEKRPFYCRVSPICICIILFLLACLAVGIWALLQYVVLKEDETPVPMVSPTIPPVSPTPVDIRQKLVDTIEPHLPDNGESLGDPDSPQSLALDWLEQDPGVSRYTDERIRRRFALAVFYYSTDGENWINRDRWLSDFDECTWYSAFDDSPCLDQDYAYLVLGDNNIRGTLPPDLVLLSNSLVGLDIGGTMSGSIPTEYGDLSNLEFVRIHGSNIEGGLSSNFKNLFNLETIDLHGNRLTGTIPSILFSSLTRLKTLDLGKNRFSGSLSTQLGKLSALTHLSLQENNLAGSIPFEIGEMTDLRTLNLDSNGFTSIPRNLGFLTTLRLLSIRNNGLTGTIPGELGFLTELQGLYLDQNNLRWTIPSQLGQLTNLEEGLGLSNNLIVGDIPSELGRLFGLKNLLLGNNKLRGTIPSTLGNINRLHTLRLEANNLSGSMPSEVCSSFSREFSTYYVDCSEVTCPCCNFCCDDESSDCTCPFVQSDPILCVP